ncbi:hypothetical protein BH012_15250 [Salmonella enterica]|nr:hypothetical protein [Salmonella enterica]ECC3252151.1 hypothetical protein [Salmonella enterica subsp. enterica]EDU6362600.1 hypothetical protein [Salmonella enterica subsp. enterica serovar Florian]EAX6602663.1 hypothetical protein [Salmonella enterica]EDS7121354.1 hypothetical protein [Salmonella enterica subsp. enterica]
MHARGSALVSQDEIGTELKSANSLSYKLNKFDFGWKGTGVEHFSFHALNKTGSWGAMMWEPGNGIGHWVVVKGVDDAENVIIYDPYQGSKYMMTEQNFKEVWNGYSVFKPLH